MAPKCHEYFGCTRSGCTMFKERGGRNCWEVGPMADPAADTFANAIKMKNRECFCRNCLFYEHINDISYEMRYLPLKVITRI